MRTIEIKKWGNSGGIILGAAELASLKCRIGSRMEVSVKEGELRLRPVQATTLKEALAMSVGCWELNDEDREWLDAPAVGKEII